MVSPLPATALLLAVVVIGVSCQFSQPSQTLNEQEQTPIAERRKFTDVKKFKFIPTIKKPKSVGGWLPSFFTRSEVTEAPVFHELAPLGQYPIWKVHKYKGIELRPVPVYDAPRTLDVPLVRGEPPRVIELPPYRPPAVEYGVPAAEYGPPKQVYPPVGKEGSTEASFAETPAEETTEKAASDEETQSSLDALSNLGSLTGLLGEGDANNLARLQFILQLFRSDKSLLAKLKNLKSWKFPLAAPQAAAPPPAPLVNGLYFPSKKDPKTLLSSFIPSFLRTSSSVPLPALPEVEEPPVTGLQNVRIQLPELPPIQLPAYTTANQIAGPYVKVKVGAPTPIPAVVAPVVQEQYYQPPIVHYNNFPTSYVGNTPLYNSYGVAIPADSYSFAASDQAPQYAAPDSISEQEQIPSVHEKEHNFRNATVLSSQQQQPQQEQQQQQPVRNLEYEDNYDMQMEEHADMMDPRNP